MLDYLGHFLCYSLFNLVDSNWKGNWFFFLGEVGMCTYCVSYGQCFMEKVSVSESNYPCSYITILVLLKFNLKHSLRVLIILFFQLNQLRSSVIDVETKWHYNLVGLSSGDWWARHQSWREAKRFWCQCQVPKAKSLIFLCDTHKPANSLISNLSVFLVQDAIFHLHFG